MRRAVWVLVLVGVLGTACGGESEAPATPTGPTTEPAPATPPPPPEPTGPEAVREVMRGHYGRARSAHDALIRADMDQARADMAWLATHEEGEALPENLRPLLAAMQAEAARFAEATTLTEAGTALARTLVHCGTCHSTAGDGPTIAEVPMPMGEEPADRMRRHRWASDRMFDGLVTANVEMFRSGNAALTSAPLTRDDLPATAPQPEDQVVALTTHVRDLGAEAAAAADDATRASIYGRYLATCGTCHRLLEGGPPEALEGAAPTDRETAVLTPPGSTPAPAPAAE